MTGAHEVYVLCNCGKSAEDCATERYVSDVRILQAEYDRLRRKLDSIARLAAAA